MVRAFTDVAEIEALADALVQFGDQGEKACQNAIRDTAQRVRRSQRTRVPRDTDETRDSITIEYDYGGLEASIGPTNRDKKGVPVGFFIEFGRGGQAPQPFVRPSAKLAEERLPEAIDMRLRELTRMFGQ